MRVATVRVEFHGDVYEAGRVVADDHDIVAAYPDCFDEVRSDRDVEQATANPGEKRSRRPAAKAEEGTESGGD